MNITNLRKRQVYELANSLLKDYNYLISENDIKMIEQTINDEMNYEKQFDILYPIVKKVWDAELDSGNYVFISWNKSLTPPDRSHVTFATMSKRDNVQSFCDSDNGIEYEVKYEAIIGALEKDAATIIEDASKKNEYTIATIDDKVINSYNGATKLITPKQLLDSSKNTYRSKHNEIILDSSLIKEIGNYKK